MKRKMLLALIAAMTVSMSVPVLADPSIGQYVEKTTKNTTGTSENQKLVVENLDTSIIKNETAKSAIDNFSGSNEKNKLEKLLVDLGVDTTKPVPTDNGGTASPVYYEPATPAFNLAISEADKLKYELTGSVTSTLTVESLKDKDKDNILIMVTDADGKVHYITPDALDPKTGELTVTFTALGSVVILEKAPIVSKNLESDKYENENVKAAAEQFKSAEEGTAVSDIFAAAGEGTTVKDQNGEDVDISQYKTCGSLVEVAMKLGDEYFTNAECQFEGTVQMDLEQVDYKALLKSAGIDENTSDEDLLNVEEFEAPDYVLAQLNAVSGEASVSTGLKFGFEKVEGSDRPVLVIKGTFNGLGPVALASKAE